jgi:hypothetical protein
MRPLSISFLAACVAATVLVSCTDALPPATRLASTLAPQGANDARVLFVRPLSPCDSGQYAVVVDDRGRFVGNVAAGTQLALPTTPGNHVFYAWTNIDVLRSGTASTKAVAAVRVVAVRGETSVVALESDTPCHTGELFAMRAMAGRHASGDELKGWLASTQPVDVDRASGQHALDASPAHLTAYLELGAEKLRANDERAAKSDRLNAVRHESE